MKRINIISLIAFLTLIACSKAEIIDSGQQQEIGFKVVNSAQTKANPS